MGAPSLSGPAAEQALAAAIPTHPTGPRPEMISSFAALRIGREIARRTRLLGPQLIFNTAMTAPEHDAGGVQFGAESFTFSPLYCGSTSVGYVPVENPSDGSFVQPNLWLGRVAALAGSDSGPHTSWPQRPSQLCSVRGKARGSRSPNGRLVGREPVRGRLAGRGLFRPRRPWRRFPLPHGRRPVRETWRVRADPPAVSTCASLSTPRWRAKHPAPILLDLIGLCRTDFGIRIEIDDRCSRLPRANGSAPRLRDSVESTTVTSTQEARRATLFT